MLKDRETTEQVQYGTAADTAQCLAPEQDAAWKLDHIFAYHPPRNAATAQKYENIREAAKHFAKVLLINVPAGADRTAALRKIREAVMTANAAVALDGISF